MNKILVIEDEVELLVNTVEALALAGYDVYQASDGLTGLQLIRQHCPDLVLSDIMMPGLDGYQLLKAVRQDTAFDTLPFVFITAVVERESVRRGMNLGADDYLTKPFTLDELLETVNSRMLAKARITGKQHQWQQFKFQFSRLVAHELRTPLTVIKSSTELMAMMLEHVGSTEQDEILKALQEGGNRLQHLIEQLTYYTCLETGAISAKTLAINAFPTTSLELVMDAVQQARTAATRNPDLPIYIDCGSEVVTLYGDPNGLRHALAEVIINALNFSSPEGEVQISIGRTKQSLWICVTDQGPGVETAHLPHLTEAFYQANRERQEQQGIGIGLYLSRQLLEMHGGELQLHSAPQQGMQIRMRLPIRPSSGSCMND